MRGPDNRTVFILDEAHTEALEGEVNKVEHPIERNKVARFKLDPDGFQHMETYLERPHVHITVSLPGAPAVTVRSEIPEMDFNWRDYIPQAHPTNPSQAPKQLAILALHLQHNTDPNQLQ